MISKLKTALKTVLKTAGKAVLIFLLAISTYLLVAIGIPQMHRYVMQDIATMSTVSVQVADSEPDKDGKREWGSGAGVVVKAKSGRSVTLTARHVCESKINAKDAVVVTYQDKRYDRKILELDQTSDLCVIESVPGTLVLSIANMSQDPGSIVYASGFPSSLKGGHAVRQGAVQDRIVDGSTEAPLADGTCRYKEDKLETIKKEVPMPGMYLGMQATLTMEVPVCVSQAELIQVDTGCEPGMSGGPVINSFGAVVGITVQRRGKIHNLMFVPYSDIAKLLERY